MTKLVTGILFFSVLLNVLGQPGNYKFKDVLQLAERYKGENAIYLYKNKFIEIGFENDSVKTRVHNSEATLILNEYSKLGAVKHVYLNSFCKVENINANTYYLNNKRYKKIEAKDIKISSSMSDYVFYDDSKEMEIKYPMAGKFSIMNLNYDEEIIEPFVIERFYFQEGIPVKKFNLNIKVHKDITVNLRSFNTNGFNIDKTESVKGDYKYYNWTLSDAPKAKSGNKYYGSKHYVPHVYIVLEEAKINDTTISFFRNEDDLFKHYNTYINQVDFNVEADFVKKVAEITKDKADFHDKAAAILYWVQDNIKYVAFAQGLRGFVPHGPQYVFDKRYGDCKDMTSLIVAMMKEAGLSCYFSWVGTREIPYTYNDLPTYAVDNHMVASYISNDSVIIMDGTMNLYKFGMTPHHLLTKEVLIRLDDNNYMIHQLKANEISESGISDSSVIYLEDNKVKGTGYCEWYGYNRYEIATAIDGVKPDRLKKSLTSLLGKGNNTFGIDSFEMGDVKNRNDSFNIKYNFSIDNYTQNVGNQLYVNLNLHKSFGELKFDTTETVCPLANDFFYTDKEVVILQIPDGYNLSYVPEDTYYNNDFFRFSIKYSSGDSFVKMNRTIHVNFLKILNEEFNTWDILISNLLKAYRQTVCIEKN
jgi:hypothetical protein